MRSQELFLRILRTEQLSRLVLVRKVVDVIAGPFFIAYAPIESEKFLSMPDELREKYLEKFRQPERFFRTPEGIKVVKFDPNLAKERDCGQR